MTDLLPVRMMPLGDMQVIKFTTALFSVSMSPIFLPIRFSWGKFVIACIQVVGNILVIQPPFLFAMDEEKHEQYPRYWLGVSISLGYTVLGAMCYILSFKLKDRLTVLHMLVFQFIGFIPSIPVTYALEMENRFFSNLNAWNLTLTDWLLLLAITVMTNIKIICIINAAILAEPAVPNSVRLVEIPFGIFLEAVLFHSTPTYLTLIGSAIVILAACGIATYDHIFVKQTEDTRL